MHTYSEKNYRSEYDSTISISKGRVPNTLYFLYRTPGLNIAEGG